jgi:hypothetical protein
MDREKSSDALDGAPPFGAAYATGTLVLRCSNAEIGDWSRRVNAGVVGRRRERAARNPSACGKLGKQRKSRASFRHFSLAPRFLRRNTVASQYPLSLPRIRELR